jgi:cation:H+ antiporter
MLVGGFIYLLFGADLLVRGAVALARRADVPPIVVALTVVALGTSLPELVVSVQAVFTGYPGIVIGNVVGSNIANVFLVAGVSAIVFPLAYPGGSIRRDSAVMMGVSLFFVGLCLTDSLNRMAGTVLLAALAFVLVPTIRDAAKAKKYAAGQPRPVSAMGLPTRRRIITLFIVLGIIGLPLGAGLVVEGTVKIALSLGVSEAVVGLSIVAFATSLPELATTVVAAYQRETDVAIGTIMGSNVFNILAIMGVATLASPRPLQVPDSFPYLDLPVMLLAAVWISAFAFLKKPVGRASGIIFVSLYLIYITLLFGAA